MIKLVMSNIQMTEPTLKDLIIKINRLLKFLANKKRRIFLISLFGGLLGFILAIFTPPKYIYKLTFVVEENKGQVGGLSALAGQFGFDLGGSGGGFFSGENIIMFLKSENLCREILLTYYDDKQLVTLADRYAQVMGMKKKWIKKKKIGEINFSDFKNKQLPRTEDSLLQVIIRKSILKNDLFVTKPDKKSTFIQVVLSSRDEKFSALFSQRLVKIATNKYVESKTKFKVANVAMLQRRADSLAALLNNKTFEAAQSQQVLVDINPALKLTPINAEISTREKSMIGIIFAEVVKNLEIAKTILSQETPAIQIVDQSFYPLEKVVASKSAYSLIFSFIFTILFISYLVLIRWIKS
jgi:hypothetical protein